MEGLWIGKYKYVDGDMGVYVYGYVYIYIYIYIYSMEIRPKQGYIDMCTWGRIYSIYIDI